MDPRKKRDDVELKAPTNITERERLSKKIHNELTHIDIDIRLSDTIENPESRIKELLKLKKDIRQLDSRIHHHLPIKSRRVDLDAIIQNKPTLTIEEHLKVLDDLDYFYYESHKNDLMVIYNKTIYEKLQIAKLESVFTKAFYVHKDRLGNETKEPLSAWHYFMGIPEKNPSKFFAAIDWLSYIGGGFAISPLKNTLKLVIEFLPNYIATRFNNRIDRLAHEANEAIQAKKEPSAWNTVDGALSSIGYGFFKSLWVLGRAVTSPLTSAKAGWETGFAFGKWLGGDSVVAQKIFGTIFGSILGAPSLVIGLAAVIATVVFVPGTLIWAIGKIPVVGVEAAAWLTSASQAVGALSGVSEVATTNSAIAKAVAPVFAEGLEFGFGAMAQMVKIGQAFLNLIRKFQPKPTPPIVKSDEPGEPQGMFEPNSPPVGGSYVLLGKNGVVIQEDKSPKSDSKPGAFEKEDLSFKEFMTDSRFRRKGTPRSKPEELSPPPPSMTDKRVRGFGKGAHG